MGPFFLSGQQFECPLVVMRFPPSLPPVYFAAEQWVGLGVLWLSKFEDLGGIRRKRSSLCLKLKVGRGGLEVLKGYYSKAVELH